MPKYIFILWGLGKWCYFNKLLLNGNYSLQEIWILKAGKKPASTNRSDWNIYPGTSKFTNNSDYAAAHPGVILITDGMILRMVYDETKSSEPIPVNFYDYDISDKRQSNGTYTTSTGGKSASKYADAAWGTQYGINSNSNYETPDAKNGKLAFGNSNTGTHLGKVRWKDSHGITNTLNSYNRLGGSYAGCTFGIVSGLKGGDIQFSKGIHAPNLFGDQPANGKRVFGNSSLNFSRSGDTYTLTSVDVSNGTSAAKNAVSNLNRFSKLGTAKNVIWSNNFWPMDKFPGVDGLSGGSTVRKWNGWKWNNQGDPNNLVGTLATSTFPPSDDGKAHNPLFGMDYEVDFTLTPDYTGPLDYFFFGDDDMWAFLDGKPIVDIGGVHSSVGQYVNLWDYIPHGDANKHTLKFFYTERGLSGSTCYMQFTLPSVSVTQPSHNTGNLIVEKKTDDTINDPDYEYEFEIRLRDAQGNELPDEYAYTKYDAQNNPIGSDIILRDKQTFTLKAGQHIMCSFLPDQSIFTVQEINAGSATRVETSNGQVFYPVSGQGSNKVPVITGTIAKNTTVSYSFINSEPKNSIQISKTLTASDADNTMPAVGTENLAFSFRLLKEDGTPLFEAGTPYTVSGGSLSNPVTKALDANGLVVLKKDETASFANSYLSQNIRYFVQELIPADELNAYAAINVNDAAAVKKDPVTIDGIEYAVYESQIKDTSSAEAQPENVTFDWNNVLNTEKYSILKIEKKLPDGVSSDQSFIFIVKLDGELVPDGTYYSADGQSARFTNGQFVLQAGHTNEISCLLLGTTYEVTEAQSNGFTSVITNSTGTIGIDQVITVTAVNIPDSVSMPIEKTDASGNLLSSPVSFALYSSMPGENPDSKEPKAFNGTTFYFEKEVQITGSGTIDGLIPGAQYVLEETKSPSGYALLSAPVYFSIDADGSIDLKEGSDANALLINENLGLQIINDLIPGLPVTGHSGSEMIAAAGAGTALCAGLLWLRKRSRK